MTTNEALETIIQQNRLLCGLLDNVVSSDVTDELKELIEANKAEITTVNNKLMTFFAGCKGEVDANNLGEIKLCLGNIGTGVGHTARKVRQDIQSLGKSYCSLYNLAHTVKSFMTATDTKDETINTWREIENFLAGIKDNESLLSIINYLNTEINNIKENQVKSGMTVQITSDNKLEVMLANGIEYSTISDKATEGTLGSPLTNKLEPTSDGLKQNSYLSLYLGNREIAENAINLITEMALKKHLDEINERDTVIEGKLLIIETGAKVAVTLSPSIIYKDTATNVTVTGKFTASDASLIPTKITILDTAEIASADNAATVSKAVSCNLTDNKTFKVEALVDPSSTGNPTKLTGSVTLNARYPIYFGFGTNAADVIANGTKQAATTTAACTYNATNARGKDCNFFILVPTDITAPTKFSMGGAPASMTTTAENLTVGGKTIAYKVIKSGGVYANGAKVEIVAS